MDLGQFERHGDFEWRLPRRDAMRVPGVIYADEHLMRVMDEKVASQLRNVATLPGIVGAAYAMPDAHWGYGFPIGGVAAVDAREGGVVSGGGVGFDISCGVRSMPTGLVLDQVEPVKKRLADALYRDIPAGLGKQGDISLEEDEMTAMLKGGARWAVDCGWGEMADLERIEEGGCMAGAVPEYVSAFARRRQKGEMGTLGSGNHYCEVQVVDEIFAPQVASAFGIAVGDVLLTVHCGSRGLGHQIGTEFLREMAIDADRRGFHLPDRELACAAIDSELGRRYLGAMRAGINCALANRQIIGHLARETFARILPDAHLELLFDVSHNTCKVEEHRVQDVPRQLYIHRKGATRAWGPGHPLLPAALREIGQPVLVGGSMGTESWILVGVSESEQHSFSSACHGAGRLMSRTAARKNRSGAAVIAQLENRGILVRSPSHRGVAEEAPEAYKDVGEVVEVTERAGLAKRVARLRPVICIKG